MEKPMRQEVKAGPTRYFGKVCGKHPERSGERRTSNGACVACHRAWVRKKQKTPGHPIQVRHRARLAKKRRIRGSHHHIKDLLSKRIRQVLHGAVKSARTQELLGCSVDQFRTHIESLFEPGMSWANAGEWHLDHIRPCASFDLTDPAQQRACFRHTNLQPLWAADNIRKSATRFRLGPLRRLFGEAASAAV